MYQSAICKSGIFTLNPRVTPNKQISPKPIQHRPIMNDMLDRLVHSQMVLRNPRAGTAP
ncbi:hypothetical protein D3C84_1233950 [compost metagenome]